VLTRRDTRESGGAPRPVLGIVPVSGAPPPGSAARCVRQARSTRIPTTSTSLLDDDTLESWGRRLSGERGRHVLDLGRTFPPPRRPTCVARSRSATAACVAPGCHADPSRCEAHHVVHWRHGGNDVPAATWRWSACLITTTSTKAGPRSRRARGRRPRRSRPLDPHAACGLGLTPTTDRAAGLARSLRVTCPGRDRA